MCGTHGTRRHAGQMPQQYQGMDKKTANDFWTTWATRGEGPQLWFSKEPNEFTPGDGCVRRAHMRARVKNEEPRPHRTVCLPGTNRRQGRRRRRPRRGRLGRIGHSGGRRGSTCSTWARCICAGRGPAGRREERLMRRHVQGVPRHSGLCDLLAGTLFKLGI